jgi:flagellar protein FliO/FliZ
LQSFFGLQLSQPLLYLASIAVILLLLAIFALVLKKISDNNAKTENSVRGRQPRLGIVDIFHIDKQRQLVIIRRDSVEHLLLLGGTNDIVVESNIVRSIAVQTQPRDAASATRVSTPQPPFPSVKAAGVMGINATPELSMAPEPSPAYAPAPTVRPGGDSPLIVPKPSDLSEIANRFQTASIKPMVAERDVSAPAASPIPFNPRPAPLLRIDEPNLHTQMLPENEPIIPAVERAFTPKNPTEKLPDASTPSIPSRDIGSLNDTLRQLLGRTRDN